MSRKIGAVLTLLLSVLSLPLNALGAETPASKETQLLMPRPQGWWTEDEVREEWKKIEGMLAENQLSDVSFVISSDEQGRPYTLCERSSDDAPCISLTVALPNGPLDDGLKENLYHEAGHVLHYSHPQIADTYYETRQFRFNWQEKWYEVFAEDFKACAGMGSNRLWYAAKGWADARILPPVKPPASICELLIR